MLLDYCAGLYFVSFHKTIDIIVFTTQFLSRFHSSKWFLSKQIVGKFYSSKHFFLTLNPSRKLYSCMYRWIWVLKMPYFNIKTSRNSRLNVLCKTRGSRHDLISMLRFIFILRTTPPFENYFIFSAFSYWFPWFYHLIVSCKSLFVSASESLDYQSEYLFSYLNPKFNPKFNS